jgi:hypothetical protein
MRRNRIGDESCSGLPTLDRAPAAAPASVEGYKAGTIELTRVLLARAYADLAMLTGELP